MTNEIDDYHRNLGMKCKHVFIPQMILMLGASLLVTGATKPSKVAEAQNTFSNMSTNPSVTQFRKVLSGNGMVCGEVNLSNKSGGFNGFQRFAYRDARHWALGEPRPSIDYQLFWEGERLYTDPSTQKGMSTAAMANAFDGATKALKLVTELRKSCPSVPR